MFSPLTNVHYFFDNFLPMQCRRQTHHSCFRIETLKLFRAGLLTHSVRANSRPRLKRRFKMSLGVNDLTKIEFKRICLASSCEVAFQRPSTAPHTKERTGRGRLEKESRYFCRSCRYPTTLHRQCLRLKYVRESIYGSNNLGNVSCRKWSLNFSTGCGMKFPR